MNDVFDVSIAAIVWKRIDAPDAASARPRVASTAPVAARVTGTGCSTATTSTSQCDTRRPERLDERALDRGRWVGG
jgi:hypothetical protein